ncbi:hypothetical protein FSP39_020445 [Pinctada imbricata]|uniref:Uncharacterized protein n=1 Tax=Pinctada imbricata TaxID=66713 RepID=A0AA89C5Q5_PINIB|nr:hypothetical protein FSP39_020445 [Pinctada imbricata]
MAFLRSPRIKLTPLRLPSITTVTFPSSTFNSWAPRGSRMRMMSHAIAFSPGAIAPDVLPFVPDSNKTPVHEIDLGFNVGLLPDIDATQKRLEFPKTWIWDSVYIHKSNTAVYEKSLPDTITSWVTTGFSIHDSEGIGLIPIANEIRVVKDFYIDIIPPASASVGSTMAVRVTVYNYLPKELTVMFMLIFGGKRSTVSRDVSSGGSNAVYMDAKVTKGMKDYNKVTVVAYDMGRFQMLDYVQKDVFVKLPGIEREYSLPKMVILDSNGQYSKSVPLSYPKSMIDGSVRVYFTVTGDVMAQSIQGLESLIRLPCGCGEQTMMYLAPNIYVLNYLHATKQLKDDFERKALSYINKGIDRQLNWRRNDGSFSVWGNRDNQGSTWLTAFVLTCFHQAQKYIYIEESIFEGALDWLLKTQNSDGSFSEGRRVIHYDMKGGVHASRVTLAAYVLLTLIENDDIPRLELSTKQAKNKAIQYILSKRTSLYRNKHGLALTAFALQKSGHSTEARELYLKLENMAQKHDGYLYWTYGLQKKWPKSSNLFKDNPNPRASPIDIETTSYALLYLSEKGNVGKGSMILKWLVSQRNPTGGFSSTQDTVVSLYALSEFVVMEQNGNKVKSNLNLTIIPKDKAGSAIGNLAFTVNTTNRLLIQQSQEFESKIQEVEIRGKGFGFAIVDIVVQYNAEAVSSGAFYKLSAKVPKGKETFDSITVNVCVSRTGVQSNGMSVVEVGVPSGFKGDISKTANNNPRYLKHIEPGFDKVVLYFEKIAGKTCFDVTAGRVDKVTQSESMPIVAYDYYEPGIQGMTNYTSGVLEQMSICDVCKECGVCQQRVRYLLQAKLFLN